MGRPKRLHIKLAEARVRKDFVDAAVAEHKDFDFAAQLVELAIELLRLETEQAAGTKRPIYAMCCEEILNTFCKKVRGGLCSKIGISCHRPRQVRTRFKKSSHPSQYFFLCTPGFA